MIGKGQKMIVSNREIRILLLYVSDVSGHYCAAKAIKQALEKLYPQVQVKEENLFNYGSSLIVSIINALYYTVVKLTPWLWGFLWDNRLIYWFTFPLRDFLYHYNFSRLYKEVIAPFSPHAVICTHNIACALCSTIKRKKSLSYSLAAVPTDYALHPYWFYKNVDFYFLPHEGLKENLQRKGIPSYKIQITGIPILSVFSEYKDRQKLKEKWDLKKDIFTILLMGGGQGMGSLHQIILNLNKLHLPVQLLVVSGTNHGLKEKLQEMKLKLDIPMKVWGYVKEVDELMEVSDLLISKPGGLTTAETLVKGLPIGIVNSLGGQEKKNQELLLKKKIAFKLSNKKEMRDLIVRFLYESHKSFEFKERQIKVKELAKPEAALDIVQKVMQSINEKF